MLNEIGMGKTVNIYSFHATFTIIIIALLDQIYCPINIALSSFNIKKIKSHDMGNKLLLKNNKKRAEMDSGQWTMLSRVM